MPHVKRKRQNDRSGASIVEFAVVAGPMFIMIFGLIEFTRVCMMCGIAEDSCYMACRHVIVPGATVQEAIDRGNEVLAVMGTRGATFTVTPHDIRNAAQAGGIDEDTASITVDLAIPMADNVLAVGRWTRGITIRKSCTMTTERYAGFFDGSSAGGS